MYKNMTYQQAKRIRSQSISSVLADQLIMGAGYGAAIKQTASAKWNAKISGIKEKFDPLNIIKFMTGGSRLGPAILGKMLGRSRKDIEYFTGRARPVQYRGPNIGKGAGSGGGDMSGVASVMRDILTFLQTSHEDNMTMREKENNYREGQKHEDERRHEALLKALGGKKQTASPVKAKSSEPSFFDNIMDSVNKLIDKYKPMLEELSAFMKGSLWPILRGTLGMLGVALIPVIAGTLFKMWWDDFRAGQAKKNVEVAQERGGDVAADAERTMNKLREEGNYVDAFGNYTAEAEAAGQAADDSTARRDYYREDFLKHSGFKRKNNLFGKGFKYVDNAGNEPSPEMTKAANQFADEETQKIFTGENKDPLNKFTFVKPAASKVNDKPVPPKPTETPKAAAPAAVVTPTSAAVVTKTSEGKDLALKAKAVTKSETTNNTNIKNVKKTPDRKISMPSVRNSEETFARLIWDSTRVV